MKVTLFDFQEDALTDLHKKLGQARDYASSDNPQVISFSAPTGAGKTVVMTALFEDLLFGTAELAPQPDAVVLWLSDMPELNEQTRLKIEAQYMNMLPYLATILVLVVISSDRRRLQSNAPASLGKPFYAAS